MVPELTRLQAERDRCANSTRDQRSMPTSEAEAVRIAVHPHFEASTEHAVDGSEAGHGGGTTSAIRHWRHMPI